MEHPPNSPGNSSACPLLPIEQLQSQIKLLEQRVSNVEREGKRQAVPFRKNRTRRDAVNFRAEQSIPPAVVNRKVWGGNRTEAGAQAQSLLMSIIRTCYQRLVDPFLFLRLQLTSPKPLTLPLAIETQ